MSKLDGKIALVTGASRGIGAATAKILAKNDAQVAVNYFKNKDAAEKVVADITEEGGKAIAVQGDVRNMDQVKAMVDEVETRLGTIDILVLNAGASVPWKSFAELSIAEFETKVFDEVRGFFYPAKAIIGGMMKRREGCIVGISSGLSRYPGFGFSAHTTAKSAVDGLMKSMAFELGQFGIRINVVSPGFTVTDATSWVPKEQVEAISKTTPLRRVGKPEDIAGAVLMMVGDETRFVQGAYLPVSGGALML